MSVSLMRRIQICMVIYLDDLLIMGISVEEKLLGRDAIIFALQKLGFVMHKEKFCLKLKKVIKFLGLIINSKFYLPLSTPRESRENNHSLRETPESRTSIYKRDGEPSRAIDFNLLGAVTWPIALLVTAEATDKKLTGDRVLQNANNLRF